MTIVPSRMLRSRIAAFGILAASLSGGEALAAKHLLMGIPMQWRPTEVVTVTAPQAGPDTATLALRPLLDRRPNPERIGQNAEDADEGKFLPVTTSDDIGTWSTARIGDLLTQGGYPLVNDAGADLFLSGEIVQFFVNETDKYKADVTLKLTLTDPDGRQVWSGTDTAHVSRFGRSYKADNYYEALSDTFLKAAQGLLAEPSFQRAIVKSAQRRAAPTSSISTQPVR